MNYEGWRTKDERTMDERGGGQGLAGHQRAALEGGGDQNWMGDEGLDNLGVEVGVGVGLEVFDGLGLGPGGAVGAGGL